VPPVGAPAAWVTEEIAPVPKNIYGVTKAAAEDLCQLFYRNQRLACVILRTSRFFPEPDDDQSLRGAFADENQKVNEYLFRRVDLEDVVSAHLLAAELGAQIGFGRYIISATTPFLTRDLAELRVDAPAVVKRYVPDFVEEYGRRSWKMAPSIGRVYVNEKARNELGWKPRYDFQFLVEQLKQDKDTRSPLARLVGSKGYHEEIFSEGPYPVEGARG
jgi:UDP-glucose 4-epimerase